MFRCKGRDRNIYEISVFYGFRLFNLFYKLLLRRFQCIKNYAKRTGKTAGKKLHTKFKTKSSQLIARIYKTFTYCIKSKRRSYESQAWSPSHLFTGKSGQNVTNIKAFSLESTRKMAWHLRVVLDAVHSGKEWCSPLWLNAMHSGKKMMISRIRTPFIYSS